jgi:hypothetical protein
MASVNVSLRISSNDVLTAPFTISVDSSMSADSGSIIKAKLKSTTAEASALTVYKADDKLTSAYLYVKNMSIESEKYVYVYNDSDNDDLVAKIGGQEFAFIPVAVNKTFKAYYSGGNTGLQPMVEYAVFGLDNSDNTLG